MWKTDAGLGCQHGPYREKGYSVAEFFVFRSATGNGASVTPSWARSK